MRSDSFDFTLPPELIAQAPLPVRDESRLMVLDRGGRITHAVFRDIGAFLSPGDLLILNDTKVLTARLLGRTGDGDSLEVLLVREVGSNEWEILSRGSYSGLVTFSDTLSAVVSRGRHLAFEGDAAREIQRIGKVPLPPYIRREPDEFDTERYQTVYARTQGSIAAPTAGLHFTAELVSAIEEKGVTVRYVTLHVGTGTFRPIRSVEIEDHVMDREYFEFDPALITDIAAAKSAGHRVVAVGTTTARTIESFLTRGGSVTTVNGRVSGHADLFIYPGYSFKAVDALLTNFHIPRSTPLLMASALAGREPLRKAYSEAVRLRYRFFSYGDAMLIS